MNDITNINHKLKNKMRTLLKTTFLIFGLFYSLISLGAYLTNVPVTIKQPDGKELNIYATGDEFHNWLHDKNGFTIIQNPKTGYYCYAILNNEEIIASKYIVGETDPQIVGLKPNINISPDKILAKRNEFLLNTPKKIVTSKSVVKSTLKSTQTLNNIVVYIRFADQTEFPANQATYTSMFNNTSTGANSVRNYFKEATYDDLDISTTFYPTNNGTTIISYQDNHIRDYYVPHSAANDSGYTSQSSREHALLQNAISFVESQIPSSLNLDYDSDGYVDNICFIVRGGTTAWNTLLWPHRWSLWSVRDSLNGARVYDYNLQLEDHMSGSGVGVLCHEMYHTLGAPDLYHYNGDGMDPVGDWDLMEHTKNPPQHMGAYMKSEYGGWITSIPEITASGSYTLNPITSSSNNCYKIPISGSTEYLILEYRRKTGAFESSLPNSGLIVYRINESYHGNSSGSGAGGVSDEVYVFRLNGSTSNKGDNSNAYLSSNSGRTVFHNSSNPNCFISNGSLGNIYIKNISTAGSTISFDIRFCDDDNITYSNTNSLPQLSNASNSISTSGAVTVKSTDNVTFEAGGEVILNGGFEIQQGGVFEINMNGCGNK